MFVSAGASEEVTPTKRKVISDIAGTSNILEWLAPPLIFMSQRLWELKLAWDEEIPARTTRARRWQPTCGGSRLSNSKLKDVLPSCPANMFLHNYCFALSTLLCVIVVLHCCFNLIQVQWLMW